MTNNERETYVRGVANTILNQLLLDRNEFMAWGSNEFSCYDKEVEGFIMPTLSFKIRTPKVPHGGYVQISLDEGADLYRVEAIQVNQGKTISLGVVNDVYFDMLHQVIRDLIEDEESMNIVMF